MPPGQDYTSASMDVNTADQVDNAPLLVSAHLQLEEPEQGDEQLRQTPVETVQQQARRLYISHWLSTWNSRVFEFGSTLYIAYIYPQTLLPMSIYAFVRGLSAIVFASAIGKHIDSGDRLSVIRSSIRLHNPHDQGTS